MDYRNRQGGFTFISMMLAIAILGITLPLIGYTYKAIQTPSQTEELEVHHFFLFLQEDVRNSRKVNVVSSDLYLEETEGSEVAVIKQHQNVIHRQVNGRGHEIYLRDVQKLSFSEKSYGVHVTVTMMEGDSYEKTIVYYE